MTDIIISKAPKDPEKKKKWVEAMLNLSLSNFVGEKCKQCGEEYKSIEEMKTKGLIKGYEDHFVHTKCWGKYKNERMR
mgnify:CR=1 FL=1